MLYTLVVREDQHVIFFWRSWKGRVKLFDGRTGSTNDHQHDYFMSFATVKSNLLVSSLTLAK